ncbi:MAG: chemotaxis protein CheB [Thermodesulfovibrio sp.]|nr:chemotaxis protein CheB [Thermodesulfovibrio sp.]
MNDSNLTQRSKFPDYFVCLGASAGGLEAIESFVQNLPIKNNIAVIIIQHLSPNYKSMMVEILSKRTKIPVHEAKNGMIVEGGNIYVIPPKKKMTISNGKLVVEDVSDLTGLNFPIDTFLRSLAIDQGEKAIAVILSGTGTDGARGIRDIKEHGGIIFVQDEKSAKFDGMPKSAISTGVVDFVMNPVEIAKKIISMPKYPTNYIVEEKDDVITKDEILQRILALLKANHNVDFTLYKPSNIIRRIERRMAINRVENIVDYLNYLYKNPTEIELLYKDFLIGVTSFFRDIQVFQELREKYIPDIIEKFDDEWLRVWVAGCSTGEEAYTISILFNDVMEKMRVSRKIKIFATDIDRRALQVASLGIYPESIAADVPHEFLSKYFTKSDNQYIIKRRIRESIVFAEHNILKDPPFTNICLLSCRNLLIYLKPETQNRLIKIFYFSLKKGGTLVLGTSESIGEHTKLFETLDSKLKIYKARENIRQALEIPIERISVEKTQDNLRKNIIYQYFSDTYHKEKGLNTEIILKAISKKFFDAIAVVDKNLNLIYLDGNVDKYFTLPIGVPSLNLEKVIKKDFSKILISMIKKSIDFSKRVKITKKIPKKKEAVQFEIIPIDESEENYFCILMISQKTQEKISEEVEVFEDSSLSLKESYIKELENELQRTKERLHATIEELETSNEELQATNEELLASNEELQATNEELQATNEELYTVNNELQNKIIELTELQNDLESLLTSSQIGIIMLDPDLRIKKYSPKVKDIFDIADIDIGAPINHINHKIIDFEPYIHIKRAIIDGRPISHEIETTDGSSYLMKINPFIYKKSDSTGVVLVFIDITEYKRVTQSLEIKEKIMKETHKIANIGGWYFDIINHKMYWTDEVYLIHGLEKREYEDDPLLLIEKSLKCYGDRAKEIYEAFNKCLKEGVPYDLIFPFKKYTGEEITIKTTGNPIYEDGKIIGVVGTIMELPKKKQD